MPARCAKQAYGCCPCCSTDCKQHLRVWSFWMCYLLSSGRTVYIGGVSHFPTAHEFPYWLTKRQCSPLSWACSASAMFLSFLSIAPLHRYRLYPSPRNYVCTWINDKPDFRAREGHSPMKFSQCQSNQKKNKQKQQKWRKNKMKLTRTLFSSGYGRSRWDSVLTRELASQKSTISIFFLSAPVLLAGRTSDSRVDQQGFEPPPGNLSALSHRIALKK